MGQQWASLFSQLGKELEMLRSTKGDHAEKRRAELRAMLEATEIGNGAGPEIVSENHDYYNSCHALDNSTGRVAIMAAGTLPWHGLGVLVREAVSSADAIRLASLDWQVVKQQLTYTYNGETRIADDAWGIVRQDTGAFLGAVGSRYAPIQNKDGFGLLDGALSSFGAKYETAGALDGGRKVWMLAQLPKQCFVFGKQDRNEAYALVTMAHDGSGALYCYPTSVRVVCNNTFTASISDRVKGISIRHTGSVRQKLANAERALANTAKAHEAFALAAAHMASKRLEIRPYARNVLDEIMRIEESRELVRELAAAHDLRAKEEAEKALARKEAAHRAALADIIDRYHREQIAEDGTAWKAFNAITDHADHNTLGRQAKDLDERRTRRFESAIAGTGDQMKQVAYKLAMA